MSNDAKVAGSAFCGDLYQTIRIDTERVVDEFVAAMRDRREKAVDEHRRDSSFGGEDGAEKAITEADLMRLIEIRMSYTTGFAHALLQGAIEAFEDQKAGLKLLKRLIDVELAAMEQDAGFASRATAAGSTAVN